MAINWSIGERVQTIVDNEVRIGIIERIYEDMTTPLAIVRFEDDPFNLTAKVPLEKLAKYKKSEPVEEKREPKLLDEVTITRDNFRNIFIDKVAVINDEINDSLFIVLTGMLWIGLEKELFAEGSDNE